MSNAPMSFAGVVGTPTEASVNSSGHLTIWFGASASLVIGTNNKALSDDLATAINAVLKTHSDAAKGGAL